MNPFASKKGFGSSASVSNVREAEDSSKIDMQQLRMNFEGREAFATNLASAFEVCPQPN